MNLRGSKEKSWKKKRDTKNDVIIFQFKKVKN